MSRNAHAVQAHLSLRATRPVAKLNKWLIWHRSRASGCVVQRRNEGVKVKVVQEETVKSAIALDSPRGSALPGGDGSRPQKQSRRTNSKESIGIICQR